MKSYFFLFVLILNFVSKAQTTGNKIISSYSRPGDNDSIHTNIGLMLKGEEPGPKIGSRINFFKLYGLNNDSLDIAVESSKGKPVFLINGSYTCPQYRQNVHFFDSLYEIYHNEISFFVIYSIEAHPYPPDPSPYTGELFMSPRNVRDRIFYRQPKTYSERKLIAGDMVQQTKLGIPVFLDTPDNQWLTSFGTMPTTAYLVNSKGKIISKYLDYNHNTAEILRDLKGVLNKEKK